MRRNASVAATVRAEERATMNIPTVPSGELAQKAVPGTFRHRQAHSRRRGSYVHARCRQRLGQWHLAAPITVDRVDVEDMCAGCIRDVGEG